MKAAVLHKIGEIPRYGDFPEPSPDNDETLIHVKAVTLENIDQMMAKGEHFARHQFLPELPAVVGIRGVGERSDGKLVGFSGMKSPYGAMAEKAVVPKESTVLIPDGINAETAVALPSTALTSLFPLKWGVKIKPGETVLINGATGVAGKLAVQIAKLLGAGRVIGTGRNEESLKRIRELGADTIVNLKQSEEELFTSFKKEINKGIDIIWIFMGISNRNTHKSVSSARNKFKRTSNSTCSNRRKIGIETYTSRERFTNFRARNFRRSQRYNSSINTRRN